MQLLRNAIAEGSVLLDLQATDIGSLIHRTLDHLIEKEVFSEEHRDEVERALLEREAQVSTAIGHAVAIPHAYLDVISEPVIVFIRLAHPLNLGAPDGIATRFVFMLLGPTKSAVEHLDTLMHIARLMSDDLFRYHARLASDHRDLLEALNGFEARTAPPGKITEKPIPEGLTYTGKLFGGLVKDVKRRLPHYRADFRDGLHAKSISSSLFLFFACLAPAVTFGGIMAELTGNNIGTIEMIVGTAICGIVYALVSGQPLIILGGTGPLLIFTMILYQQCVAYDIEFLATRAWVGVWTGILLLIMAATDCSCLMRYFTRFIDEIFSALISIIFIFTALESLTRIFNTLETGEHHATAILSLLLALGTLYIAHNLSRFRRSRYLLPWMREFLSDFGPTIALAAMTLFAVWMHDVDLKELPVPDSFRPTADAVSQTVSETGDAGDSVPRAWLVDMFSVPTWVWFASLGPALLVALLVFVDQNITARLVNSPDHKLTKGEAYHLDLAIMGVLIAVCSMFGLPWLVAATVRSLNHVRSLATVEEVITPGGDKRERIIHVRETRVTGLVIHVLIGFSLLVLPYLKVVPMAVLYGLFLFMGLVSMVGNQFFQRLSLWLMDSSLYPATHYIRKVPTWTIHKFTLLQLVCLGVLGFVEVSPLGILFPLFVILLVPVRLWAGRIFEPEHLEVLDADEEPEEEEMQWA